MKILLRILLILPFSFIIFVKQKVNDNILFWNVVLHPPIPLFLAFLMPEFFPYLVPMYS